jgi:2-polyprenyl-6-methoxyphenol hydroxylase-like FAD-dependent oxidoreductase
MTFQYDVIIAGAGPVGLFLASEIALAKCSVLILERAEDPKSALKQLPFGLRGLSASSIEALDRRGLLRDIATAQRTAPKGRGQAGHFAGMPLYLDRVDPSQWPFRLPSSTDTSMASELQQLETVLARRAEELGVHIKRGFSVTDFSQSDDAVTVRSGDEAFQCAWLVGCDGSRSAVRKAGAFEFAGTEPEFTGYSTTVDLADPEKLALGRNLTPHGMYVQSEPGYIVIQDYDGGAGHTGEPLTRKRVQDVLRRVSGTDVTIAALHLGSTWTDRARQATTFRKGRVFLAGDAAHIHAPLGGQGLNLGLGDATNLGWKVAAAIHRNAPHGLLDTYHAERSPIAARVLDWSRAQVAIMRPDPGARAIRAIVRDLTETSDGATYFAGRLWGISTSYDLGDAHPLIGKSVPNFSFDDGTTMGSLMHHGRWILLDFDGTPSLERVADEYGDQVTYAARRANIQLGLGALLVRPDGHVVWASEHQSAHESLLRATASWFARPATCVAEAMQADVVECER